MILRNHGLLMCGESIAEAFDLMYYLERACQTQIDSDGGGASCACRRAKCRESRRASSSTLPYKAKNTEWKAHLRMLDRTDPSYKQ